MLIYHNQQWQTINSLHIHDGVSYKTVTKGFIYKNNAWRICFQKINTLTFINDKAQSSASIFELMGSPTKAAHYLFINNATINAIYGKPALRTGIFPTGATLTIINNSYIRGYGGNGGKSQQSGAAGGDALLIENPCSIDNTNGFIYGGGGGGGGFYAQQQGSVWQTGGAGGAGSIAGIVMQNSTRPSGSGYTGTNSSAGSLDAGGVGGWGAVSGTRYYEAGNGGSVGQAGTASRQVGGGAKQIQRFYAGGAAGLAINKNGFIIELINPQTAQIKGNIK